MISSFLMTGECITVSDLFSPFSQLSHLFLSSSLPLLVHSLTKSLPTSTKSGLPGNAHLQINNSIRPISLKRIQDNVSLEVSSVQPRQRKAVAVASEGSRSNVWACRLGRSAIHVLEDQVEFPALDAATLVWNLDRPLKKKGSLIGTDH